MATVVGTRSDLPNNGVGEAWAISWANMKNGDVGDVVELPEYHDRSVQVVGTFGAAGNVRVEGSNDGTNFAVLHDPSSTALNITTASIAGILEATRQVRPEITAGDGTTSLTVTMFLRRTR